MKNVKKQNIYIKLSLVCATLAFLTQCGLFVFVLLPIYALINANEENPNAKLEVLSERSKLLSYLVYFLLAAVLFFGITGYYKMKQARKHDKR